MTHPWPPGSVTGIGSLPGTDPLEAAALVFGELPDLPHLAELPDRGAGADLIGRGACLLVDLPVEIVPSGWRIAAHSGRDLRQARDHLSRDLDALEQHAAGYHGALKLQAGGPWTLASSIELPSGHKLVTDQGAVRDLVASLAEGLRAHLADVASRVPAASLVLQLDEPTLPAVLGGRVPTPSGYGTVRSIDPEVAERALCDVLHIAALGGRVIHCCAADVPIQLLRSAGADALSVDASTLRRSDYDALGEVVEAGVSLWLGVVGATASSTLDSARQQIRSLWAELGFAPEQLAGSVVPTPACGLASATPDHVRSVLSILRDTGRSLVDEG